MKTLINSLAALFVLALVSNTTFAQVEDEVVVTDETTIVTDDAVCDGTGEPQNLLDGTGEGLKQQINGKNALGGVKEGVMAQTKENGSAFKDAFRATMTDEQLAIIENMELTRDEKREALQATFTGEQSEMFDGNQAASAARQAERGSLNAEKAKTVAESGRKGRN